MGLLVYFEVKPLLTVTIIPILSAVWLLLAHRIKSLLQSHFYSLSNVIESVRVGDYSLRIAKQENGSAWSDVYREINLLAQTQQDNRIQGVESHILLDKLLAEFDAPVFIFDRSDILKNINPMGCELLSQTKQQLVDKHAKQIHLDRLLAAESRTVLEHWFPNKGGRWELRKNYFVQDGVRYTLILVNDLSRTLREEERNAWIRLIRVLGHELNNSLASLSSVSQSLQKQLHDEKTSSWYERYSKALSLIDERSMSLLRFTEAYTRLAKLPPPQKAEIKLHQLFDSLKGLVSGTFEIIDDKQTTIEGDRDQLSQLFINLMKNAVEASSIDKPVHIQWQRFEQGVRVQIIDEGIGLPSSDNLFVPFYTTKSGGSGIGLFLSQQIAEGHNGSLQLHNRSETAGCVAEVWLPS